MKRWGGVGRSILFSRLTRLILVFNITGLLILVFGVLVLGEMRRGLIAAQEESLRGQAELVANAIGGAATQGEPEPRLLEEDARRVLRTVFVNDSVRALLFNRDGELIADSYLLTDRVLVRDLPPLEAAPASRERYLVRRLVRRLMAGWVDRPVEVRTLQEETATARLGETVSGERFNRDDDLIVSVSVPVQRVQAVLGVLTLEYGGVDSIIAAERRALTPVVFVAIAVTVLSAVLLTFFIARPIRRLALAADAVRREGPRAASIPDLSKRRDEIGDLSASLSSMTRALSDRIEAIEQFAADVAHEVKNPLSSIQSAVEVLPSTRNDEQRERLLKVVRHDVTRIDRLITDISNASKIDSELSRERAEPIDLAYFLRDIVELYGAVADGSRAPVRFSPDVLEGAVLIEGLSDQLGRVFRNLIDNAQSFSPPDGVVEVGLTVRADPEDGPSAWVTVDDVGPGVPEADLERIFSRFFSQRPKGAKFGTHSGLGLAIARQIVAAHGGRIWAENRLDEGAIAGARFIVKIPLVGR